MAATLVAVPHSWAFALFPIIGFNINTIALMGLVLAIGLVVDDAIVVVEAVEHHIEHGLSPKEATLKAMEEVSGPVVAIALVLSSVFLPTIFIPGITGKLYQQFAVTIAISVLISAFNALTLSPALSALLLRPKKRGKGPLQKFYDWFNNMFGKTTNGYVRLCGGFIRKSLISLLFLGIIRSPRWFRWEDPRRLSSWEIRVIFMPPTAQCCLLQRTDGATGRSADPDERPALSMLTIVGYSLLSGVTNTYSGFFYHLKPWHERKAGGAV
jgi:HAE1 family hydrophobic/amphiphilic exporter-1